MRNEARRELIIESTLAGVGVLILLLLAFNSPRNLGLTMLNLELCSKVVDEVN